MSSNGTIYKYRVPIDDSFTLQMPKGMKPLHVDVQKGEVCLWALVNPDNPMETYGFHWLGTGHPVGERTLGEHIGTVLLHDGALVFHLFRGCAP